MSSSPPESSTREFKATTCENGHRCYAHLGDVSLSSAGFLRDKPAVARLCLMSHTLKYGEKHDDMP